MERSFLEGFPTLKFSKELKEICKYIRVTRVVRYENESKIIAFIICDRLVQMIDIIKIQDEMQRQLFPDNDYRVIIRAKYCLSEQYELKSIWENYYGSLLYLMEKKSKIYSIMLKKSSVKCSDDTIRIEYVDRGFNDDIHSSISSFIEYVFSALFDKKVKVEYCYSSGFANRFEEEDYKIKQRVGEISKRTVTEAVVEIKEDNPKIEKIENVKKNSKYKNVKPVNKDVIYGRDFEGDAINIEDIDGDIGEVIIRGEVIRIETREIKNDKMIVTFDLYDYTNSISAKMFIKIEQKDEVLSRLSNGTFIKVKGMALVDSYDKELMISSVVGVKSIPPFTEARSDLSLNKRVELHCHTKLSDMDGVASAGDLIKTAKRFGHHALAITDHGNVQGFTEAFHAIKKNDPFKIIYGLEAYLVDDLDLAVYRENGQNLDDEFVVFDIETTGFSPVKNRIIEIAAVRVKAGEIIDTYETFVNPEVPIPLEIEKLTNISDDMVINAPLIDEVIVKFLEYCGDAVLVAHNANFDMSFIIEKAKNEGIEVNNTYVDTLALSRLLLPKQAKHTLNVVAKAFNVVLESHHRAIDDTMCTAKIFIKMLEQIKGMEIYDLAGLRKHIGGDTNSIRKIRHTHATILCKNDIGRVNLYRLVSESHINYYNRVPKIPKSLLVKYREGLLVGSGCREGELYSAILEENSAQRVAKIVDFYDYLEVQPAVNNKNLIADDRRSEINSIEDLNAINKRIVELGEIFDKLVVATGDVHFINPEDEIYRRIIMVGKGDTHGENQPPLYYRTTEEMLKEFEFLGDEKAREIVITNSNIIADMLEKIEPVRPDKCPPVIENSDKDLTQICYEKAHSMYGANLPKIVEDRLKKELDSIIKNGFAVMYIIAQKLVWKSVEDGYLVGSRGSVGSSFVATMSGITEVNPLSPHYYCDNCYYSDFESDYVKSFSGMAGCDMEDRVCPNCGRKLSKDGFDIPFETFLGFNGDKEPDIDLNFSGEYQSKAHKYTEVIFGKGQTFRAGTIGTLADKTAYGYVKKYFDEKSIQVRKCEINRIVQGCVGVRKSTGQHPGGIIVLPLGEDINSFTPVQRAANKLESDTITTHFDYHSIDHNLLKLDILGHDDPTMIRMLEDLTGTKATEVPLDDKDVMSLFGGTKALGITPEQIGGCKMGSLGIPEFGTEFVIQMLEDTKPSSFSDLVRISGLSHGTDVWLSNAQTLIQDGKATISTAICTRDDIMTYLIHMGVDSSMSFKIMESVRKGKGLTPEWEEAMVENNVPEWYIWSCKKIKYMFPKAHAAAYVMMAWRIAYYKVNYPLAYYAAFFSIRASAFDYEIMCQGERALEKKIKEIKDGGEKLSKKSEDIIKDAKIVQEMYARGFEFLPIDLYRAKATQFQIIDGKIMPPFSSIDGLGEIAAQEVWAASQEGEYKSISDFKNRTKASKTAIELMSRLGLFGTLPQDSQLSFFDMM